MYVLWRIIVKEFLQLAQDKKMIPLVLVAPIMQLLAFGYAANLDVASVDLLLVDRDRSPASRALVDRFTASPYFELVGTEESVDDIDLWLVDGRADAALVIDAHYGRRVAGGGTPDVQVIVDGSDSTSATLGS